MLQLLPSGPAAPDPRAQDAQQRTRAQLLQTRKHVSRPDTKKGGTTQMATRRGRPPKQQDPAQFAAVVGKYRAKEVTAAQAAQELNVSRMTFFRKLKEQPQKEAI